MNQATNHETEVIDPELVEEGTAVVRRSPTIPVTLAELAALKGEAMEIIEARIQVLETLRKASIRATHPSDWLLFKSPDGNVTGYLQDCGADRVRDLYGIEIYGLSLPQKEPGMDGAFSYIITGSGRCKLTRQVVENMEGGRSSTDDFCQGKKGAELELAVRKAARANLDGNITRELAGLKNVPLQELEGAWSGTNKKASLCRQGRGFGTQKERQGGHVQQQAQPSDVPAPVCEFEGCGKTMKFIPAGENAQRGTKWSAFWSCPDYKKGNGHSAINDSDYRASLAQREPGAEG